MTRPPKRSGPATDPSPPVEDAGELVQLKVWLHGTSPTVWHRLLVPGTCGLRELHGVVQVAMGWQGIHLYQFCLRTRRLGSWELSASSPDVTLAASKLCRGMRFTYEYDLNVPWRHELHVEGHPAAEPGKAYPHCTGGSGACPPEGCGGLEGYFAGVDGAVSLDGVEDLETVAEILSAVVFVVASSRSGMPQTRSKMADLGIGQPDGAVPEGIRMASACVWVNSTGVQVDQRSASASSGTNSPSNRRGKDGTDVGARPYGGGQRLLALPRGGEPMPFVVVPTHLAT